MQLFGNSLWAFYRSCNVFGYYPAKLLSKAMNSDAEC